MDFSLDTPSFARTPRLSRMRSQRVVHVVQTEKNKDVSFVTMSEDGHAEETQGTVDFQSVAADSEKEPSVLSEADRESDRQTVDKQFVFEVDLKDGTVQQLTQCDCDEATRGRKGSLFSDDEFEPIRMRFPKRRPQPLRLQEYKSEKSENVALASPALPSAASDESSQSGSLNSPTLSFDSARAIRPGHGLDTGASSSTLFSLDSAVSSDTCVECPSYTKSGGRTCCAYDKVDRPHKSADVTRDSFTETRGLVDLRFYGYDFGWSRFAGRSEVAHGLSPEDAAELEVFLSKRRNALPSPVSPKRSPKKSGFEKRLLEIFKLIK